MKVFVTNAKLKGLKEEVKKQVVDEFAKMCIDEMRQWYFNHEMHDGLEDPLVVDDMTSNAIATVKQIAEKIKNE